MNVEGREVNEALCSCGGKWHDVEPTAAERRKHDCGRPHACCTAAAQCDKCGTRILFKLAAPDY